MLARFLVHCSILSKVGASEKTRRFSQGRAGCATPSKAQLEFQLAHALARDAVHQPGRSARLPRRWRRKVGLACNWQRRSTAASIICSGPTWVAGWTKPAALPCKRWPCRRPTWRWWSATVCRPPRSNSTACRYCCGYRSLRGALVKHRQSAWCRTPASPSRRNRRVVGGENGCDYRRRTAGTECGRQPGHLLDLRSATGPHRRRTQLLVQYPPAGRNGVFGGSGQIGLFDWPGPATATVRGGLERRP